MNLIFKNNFTIGRYFKFKDVIPKHMQSNVVYKYTCSLCSETYCGETTRHLRQRIAEHMGVSHRTNLPITNPNSQVFRHFLNSGHRINEKDFEILHCERRSKLKIAESIIINLTNPTLNTQGSSIPLNILV